MLVIARTDSSDLADIEQRVAAFHEAGADAVLVDAIKDLSIIKSLKEKFPGYYMFNQIAGGKSPTATLTDLKSVGVSLVNYSTPCLFTAQSAITERLIKLKEEDGLVKGGIG
jgi:2-methylisocitrate lyase-like PEP mutase family enzyme